MKIYKSLLAAIALVAASATFSGCNEDLAYPPLDVPQSDWKANTTIAELKAKFWKSSETNYFTEVGTNDQGEHIIIGGRIVANDISGNIYQNLVLQDETGAVNIAVYMKDLNVKYKVGEEMLLDVTGLYAGMYAGLFEIGKDDYYNNTTPQIGKMDEEVFLAHAQLNGLPEPDAVNVIDMTIPEIQAGKGNVEFLQKYQSQLIRLNGVSWKGGGEDTYGVRGTSHNTRYLYNADGQSIAVDNSGMSDFNDQILPAGHGDVTAILSYYNGNWQLQLRSQEDCIDFGGESYAPVTPEAAGDGTAEAPFNVGAVLRGDAAGAGVWVTGYIVGWIDGMTMASGAQFSAPASVNSNILLAATPDEKAVANCIPVALPNGTSLRTDLNLQNNAANLGKEVSIKGNITSYFGATGLKEGTLYTWGATGDESGSTGGGDTPETPPTGDNTYTLATSITSGSQYVLVVDGQVGAAIASNLSYGRLTMEAVSITNGSFTTAAANALTITAVTGGYTIVDANGRYLGMDATHLTSFQLYTSNQDNGCVWTITVDANGVATITNVLNPNCQIVRSGTYTNIAPSDIVQYPTFDAPYIYVKSN